MGGPRPLFFIFGLFKQTLQFLEQINAKISIQYTCAGIRTHDFQHMSLLP